MSRIHRGDDLAQVFTFNDFDIIDVANIYFDLINPFNSTIKKVALYQDGEYQDTDIIVLSQNQISVLINRAESESYEFGFYNFKVRVAYSNPNYEDSIEIRSESFPSFRVVSDAEATRISEDITTDFPEVGNGGDVVSVNGKTGVVTLSTDDVLEGDNKYYSDEAVSSNADVLANSSKRTYPLSDEQKLSGIESGAEINQTDGEIKQQYEANNNTNAFTDGEKDKLSGLESNKALGKFTSLSALQAAYPSPEDGSWAYVDEGAGFDIVEYIWDFDSGIYVLQGGSSTAETPASVKQKYESNADTNVFTDSEKSAVATNSSKRTYPLADEQKLGGIESGAEINQTDAEIKVQYEANPNTNPFTDANKVLIESVESGATKDTALTVKQKYESNTNTNAFTDAEKTAVAANSLKVSFIDAPSDGEAYARQDGQYVIVPLATFNMLVSVLSGGEEGQALVKASNADYDFEWKDVTLSEVIDTIYGGNASSVFTDTIVGGNASSNYTNTIYGGNALT